MEVTFDVAGKCPVCGKPVANQLVVLVEGIYVHRDCQKIAVTNTPEGETARAQIVAVATAEKRRFGWRSK